MLMKIGAAIFLVLGVFSLGIWVGRRQMRKDYKTAEEVREWLLGREKDCSQDGQR